MGGSRHGICQMFYTSEIPKIFYFTRKDGYITTIKNVGCFTHQFKPFVCIFANVYPNTMSLQFFLWKIKPEFGKFHRKGNFRVNSWIFYPIPKYYTQVPFVPFVPFEPNSKSGWQVKVLNLSIILKSLFLALRILLFGEKLFL